MIKAGIIGSTGYAGGELVRILTGHKEAEIKWYGSRSYIDQNYADVYRNLFQIVDAKCMDDNMDALADQVDVIFTATPQGLCASLINEEIVSVPIVGKVAAGYPISAVENIEEYFPLPKSFTGDTEVYMLKVSGESMINAGIFDGDIVVVRKQDIAKNGEIVVALIDDEATVKRFYLEKDHVRLEPENPLFEPIITTRGSVIGKVIGLIRTIH